MKSFWCHLVCSLNFLHRLLVIVCFGLLGACSVMDAGPAQLPCRDAESGRFEMDDQGVGRGQDFLVRGTLLSEIRVDDVHGLPDFLFRLLPGVRHDHSLRHIEYRVLNYDEGFNLRGRLISNDYDTAKGVLTFRGGSRRDMPVSGSIQGIPERVEVDWVFSTDFNDTRTRHGVWGGGMGWTGQPLIVQWPDSLIQSFSDANADSDFVVQSPELIIAALSGTVFFLDLESGEETRPPIATGNPLKGTPSLDPRFNGMLYAGHGVPHADSFGIHMIDLHKHASVFFYSGHTDRDAYRRWGAFDSSPLLVGDYLYWPGENGLLYKFFIDEGEIRLVSKLVYRVHGRYAPGIESSLAVYRNYGYFGDNHGNIICVNLLTMEPVWHYNNFDDTDATIVIEVEDGIPFLYTGTQVDRQGEEGYSRFAKLNGLDGTEVWTNRIKAYRVAYHDRYFDGGMYATPLLGRGNASGIIVSNVAHTDTTGMGELIAFYRESGDVAYRTPLRAYSWSSPVALYNELDEMFIFTADRRGTVYLIDGSNGEILLHKNIGHNFEASPVVWGNSVVIGSRGREIYKIDIR